MTKIDLSKREKEVADLLCQGLTAKEIGVKLFVSTRTIECHRERIYKKLSVRNCVELTNVLHGKVVREGFEGYGKTFIVRVKETRHYFINVQAQTGEEAKERVRKLPVQFVDSGAITERKIEPVLAEELS